MKGTYNQITDWVFQNHGFKPKSCWIAHVKELSGLSVPPAHNRNSLQNRRIPCPNEKQEPIKSALRNFGIIP